MRITRLLQGVGLALGSISLAHAAWAQQTPVMPPQPRQAAVTQEKAPQQNELVTLGGDSSRTKSISIRIYCGPRRPLSPPALILINSRIVVGEQFLTRINPAMIEAVEVHKDAARLPGWPPLTNAVSGLIAIQLKRGVRVPSIPMRRLAHRLHLKGPVQVEQYGQLLPVAQLRIAKVDSRQVTVRVVAPGDTRIQLAASAPPSQAEVPPGAAPRVMIRGMARQ